MSHENLPEGISRETMEFDVLVVGGGVAGLSAAYKMAELIQFEKERNPEHPFHSEEPSIAVIEKAAEIGNHSLSGAVVNPKALQELFPHFREEACPIEAEVHEDEFYFLTSSMSVKSPVTPPPFENRGNLLVSISKLNRWMGQKCESKGVNVFPGFAGVEVLYENGKVVGVRTGDKGRDKSGVPKSNFEPGLILKAKVIIFAEGTRGSLFKKHCQKFDLRRGKNPDVFEEGVKEIIQMPKGTVTPGKVIHTLGFPLSKTIGGTFIYTLPEDKIALGLVVYLDTNDPLLDPHRELQRLKTHPFMQKMLAGGQVVAYGGKTLPAGGWYSVPQLSGEGWMVLGDSASFVDVQKLKGIHLAMKSGILAAETAIRALAEKDYSARKLLAYDNAVNGSYIKKELYRVRNFHQTLTQGLISSLPMIALQEITGGRGLVDEMKSHENSKTTEKVVDVWGSDGLDSESNRLPAPDGKLFYDKLSSVFLTGTNHDENSPNHLLLINADVCRSQCEPQYKSPCNHFCPANVYEMLPSQSHPGMKELQINFTNCIHCKTCDIKCPFENIDWTPPEGGGGPKYSEL